MEGRKIVSSEYPEVKIKCSVKEGRVTYNGVVMAKGKVIKNWDHFRVG